MRVALVRGLRVLGAPVACAIALGAAPAGAVEVDLPIVGDQGGQGIALPDLPVDSPIVDEVNNTVEDVTGDLGLGGQQPADPPDNGTGTPEPGPAEPSAPSSPDPTPSGGSVPQPTTPTPDASGGGGGGGNGGGANVGNGAGAPGDGAARPASATDASEPRADREGGSENAAAGENDAGTPVQELFQEFVALPSSILLVILALALLGLGMVVRSTVLAIQARRLRARQAELHADIGALQLALMPTLPERIGEVGISAAYRPFDGPAAGGDFIDVMALDERRFALVVGDVSGHDRDALAATGLVHYTVRAYLEAGLEPRDALRLTDEALGHKLESNYATVLAGVYDADTRTLLYATAGHPAPIIAGGGEDRPVYAMTPSPIGLGPTTGFRQTRIGVAPGSRICLYTDGLVDAIRADGEPVGRDGIVSALEGLGDDASAPALLEKLLDGSSARDDMTACVLGPVDGSGASFVVEEIDLGPAGNALRGLNAFLAAYGLGDEEGARVRAAIEATRDLAHTRLRLRRGAAGVSWSVDSTHSEHVDAQRNGNGGGAEFVPLNGNGNGANGATDGHDRTVSKR
jgi:hypothetical protein